MKFLHSHHDAFVAMTLVLVAMVIVGCAPGNRLTFPAAPIAQGQSVMRYDTNGSGVADFSVRHDGPGGQPTLAYDDDEDGQADRLYHLADYADADVPHVVIMLDSVPYRTVARWRGDGAFPWFGQEVKVIPPVPNFSEVVFSELLHTAPQPGLTLRYYDQRTQRNASWLGQVVWSGKQLPMERVIDYHADIKEQGLSFLQPRPWYAAELARAKRVIDNSPTRLTLVYLVASTGMVCKYGQSGADEVLAGAQQLCLQLLYERRGAIRISLLSDHGHTFVAPESVDIEAMVRDAGYRAADRLAQPRDVVIDEGGLVNVVGLHTQTPGPLAERIAQQRKEVAFTAHLVGDRVLITSAAGQAEVAKRNGRYRYRTLTGDPLGYSAVVEQLAGVADAQGYVEADTWLAATADHRYPDGPVRLWQAFHELVVSPPDVLVNFTNDYCAAVGVWEPFIDMASTHGSLEQSNSVAFVMTMFGRLDGRRPLRSADVLPAIEPSYKAQLRGQP